MSNQIIFTDLALRKMSRWTLTESTVLDAFNKGIRENAKVPGAYQMIKKYSDYEIGVIYKQDSLEGKYIIISVWKRERR